MRNINKVMKAHTSELMSLEGVVGLYIGALPDKTPCIKVMVAEKTPSIERRIPKQLEGYPIEIDVTGIIRAL